MITKENNQTQIETECFTLIWESQQLLKFLSTGVSPLHPFISVE